MLSMGQNNLPLLQNNLPLLLSELLYLAGAEINDNMS